MSLKQQQLKLSIRNTAPKSKSNIVKWLDAVVTSVTTADAFSFDHCWMAIILVYVKMNAAS